MYFLDHLVSAGVTALQFSPAMNVHGVLQLFLQSLASCPLSQQLSLNVIQLSSAKKWYFMSIAILACCEGVGILIFTQIQCGRAVQELDIFQSEWTGAASLLPYLYSVF